MAYSNKSAGCIPWMTARRSILPNDRWADRLMRQSLAQSSKLQSKDLTGHYGCVNAIEFSHGLGQFIASGGDDRRILLWNVEKALSDIGKPMVMKGEHNSNIFCVAFDITNNVAFSGGNDEQVIVHDLNVGETIDAFAHNEAVYGLSPDPTNPYVFASSCDDGRVLIYDIRDSCADPFCLANYTSSMHSVMYNPVEPRLLATANAKEGVALWDVRKPRSCVLRYGGSFVQQSCMSVRFNQRGDQIIALRRRLPPVMYNIHSNIPVCEFDHSGYYNSCTMKSISFAGDNDQYVLSGSDEFNLYMWAVPDDLSERSYVNSAHMVLKGHRSIVNQVRFNPANHLIISSGVEKIIKVWSPFTLSSREENNVKSTEDRSRRVYSHEEYINLVLQNGNVMSHDYSTESTDEDPRMMAFFDSLVQRELDGWSSDDSMSSNEEALYSRIVQLSQSDIDSDESLPDLGQNDDNYSPFTIAFASVMAMQTAEGNERFPRLNQALENAERSSAAARSSVENANNSDREPSANLNGEESSNDNTEAEAKKKTELLERIKRKKEELRDTMRRRMKYLFDKDSSDSTEDSEDLSDSDDNCEYKSSKGKSTDTRNNENSQRVIELGKSKEAKIKLTRLKDLRNSVMNNEDKPQELEIGQKTLDVLPSTSNASDNESNHKKVEFKKFKRKNQSYCDKNDSDKKVGNKSSSDLGPFLKKAGSSSSTEGRKSSAEEEKTVSKGKKSCDSYSVRGKQKSKTHDSRRHPDGDSQHNFKGDHSSCSFRNANEHSHTSDKDKKCGSSLDKGMKSGHSDCSGHSRYRTSKDSDHHGDKRGYEHSGSHRHYFKSSSHSDRRRQDEGSRSRDKDRCRTDSRNTGKSYYSSNTKDKKFDRHERTSSRQNDHREHRQSRHRSKSDGDKQGKTINGDTSESRRGDKRSSCDNDQGYYEYSKRVVKSSKYDRTSSRTHSTFSDSDSNEKKTFSSDTKSFLSNVSHRSENQSETKASLKSTKLTDTGTNSQDQSVILGEENGAKTNKSTKQTVSHDSVTDKIRNDKDDKSNIEPVAGTSTDVISSPNTMSDSSCDNQLTWLEFKRFKNKYERARKRYDKDKVTRRDKRHHSDDK
ncbi:DDB1- and CUL4-associated factor 5 [Mactra antiquata]